MTISCKTIAVASTSALVGLLAGFPRAVDAATVFWDLEFLDDSENEIGTGWLSYDDTAPFERDFYVGDDPTSGEPPIFSIDKSDNWFLIDGFYAEIQGQTWDFSGSIDYLSWIPQNDRTGTLANVAFSRFGEPSIQQDWLFGDPIDLPFLTLWTSENETFFLQASTDNSAYGSWTATRRDNDGKEVPEGGTVLAGLMGMGAISRFKQRAILQRSRFAIARRSDQEKQI
ncbi:MAG TPA: hypothetical protein IGS17_19040 [Oscillatoriales cyanobacterium M59_W2019_021]|nr:MAG: hypothetical protein D6728_11725 [Cyanobacteria bacterium J055]HIK32683.1 hypothetical protein [Oscillatoriales cyanobacterium M4454_W2019_049]HIK52993.1 hypothetical protein [Oscillatoriales cyanobacterium M59_W2019_021]